jgi:DNA-binding transcriptional MerR regulator
MPSNNTYSLQNLADLADVSPRTVRYYIAQGLLPSPRQVGPGAHYADSHLARLRLIRRLQREHLPLAEIRTRLGSLDDDTIAGLARAEATPPPEGSALDYVRAVLRGGAQPDASETRHLPLRRLALPNRLTATPATSDLHLRNSLAEGEPPPAPGAAQPAAPPKTGSTESVADRSQWDRVSLTPDIELHIRRPLSRHQNKRVDRLIAIARELLEEDPS